ncbi:integrase [Leekyejoonella antrihumi]|uniref:Integrase n=1 Tax=Leekyejoonella antrihumi TaxID=1660198 RepID=A0A563DR51_9MICO|nr:integrase [Leekyejoonella antrihumi]TWP32700.1 integrase [Leekyejoonella antrihumi]
MRTSLAAVGQADQTWHVGRDDPFATAARLPEGTDPEQVSRFGDQRWNYTVLSRRRSEASKTVNWAAFPETWRESFRRAGWALVNLPTPAVLLDRAATARVEWPAPGTMAQVFLGWRRFAGWLADHALTRLDEVDEDLLADYAVHVGRRGCSSAVAQDDLNAVTLLWGFAPLLPAADRIPMPPWENEGVKHYLATDTTPNENTTAAIHPAVMSPLLIWSLRFLDLADDIIAAWREHQRLLTRVREHPNPDATAALPAFLDTWIAEHGELPGGTARGRRGIAAQYLAATFETSERHATYVAAKYRQDMVPVGLEAPLASPLNGVIHGRQWKSHINFHEAPILMTRLATAAMIVILYLSGVRPGEALELQVGCCPDPIDDGTGSIRYQLHGRFFKGARHPDGTPARGGVTREVPWTVVPPVADAVRVLERIVEGPLLFPTNPSWTTRAPGRRQRTGDALTTLGANARIASFIAWVNDYVDNNGPGDERIPNDPDGGIVVKRALRRLPGGRIALALQYGHLRTSVVGEGYSGRARQGLRRVLDIETARAMADYLDTVAEDLHNGQGVSGLAAERMIQAARTARSRFEGKFLTPRQAEALLEEPGLHVYDNPNAFLTCNHDPAKALCHPERTRRNNRALPPAIDRCDPACANIARTDTHIDQLRREISELAEQVSGPLTPIPLKERLKQRIAALQRVLDRHERTKTTAATTTIEEPPPPSRSHHHHRGATTTIEEPAEP